MKTFSVSIPHTGDTPKTITVDGPKLTEHVIERLAQIAAQGRIRSAVNNAFNLELDKAETAAREAHDKSQAEAKAKDAKHKIVKFDSKAFKAAFTPTVDAMAKAVEAAEALYRGEIRERGTSAANKLLSKVVKNNLVMAMVAKGKKQRDAATLIGDDPFGYIERTARKRAGENDTDGSLFKAEMAKLDAQYVAPARKLLGDEPEPEEAPEGEDEGTETEETPGDDLV